MQKECAYYGQFVCLLIQRSVLAASRRGPGDNRDTQATDIADYETALDIAGLYLIHSYITTCCSQYVCPSWQSHVGEAMFF